MDGLDLSQRFAAVGRFGDDAEAFSCQERFEPLANDGVVVSDQYPGIHIIRLLKPSSCSKCSNLPPPRSRPFGPGMAGACGEGLMADPTAARGKAGQNAGPEIR